MTTSQGFLNDRVMLHHGDCLEVLASLSENSVDSIVTDPPYHLTSIVKRFGADGKPLPQTAAQKRYGDGSYSNVPQGKNPEVQQFNRLSRGFMGKQWDGGDIAFRPEVWAECLRVLKPGGYLLAFASTRGFGRMSVAIEDAGFITHPMIAWVFGSGFPKATRIKAEGYDEFRYGGQALKPAIEPIYMGQKPFAKGLSGTENIVQFGTGAINIGGCRVGDTGARNNGRKVDSDIYGKMGPMERVDYGVGRWPANLIHDGSEEVIAAFPEAPGQQQDINPFAPSNKTGNVYGKMNRHGEKTADARYTDKGSTNFAALPGMRRGDSGSAARFFYQAKADSDDRIGSRHPTVKPMDLMQYLCRLITPPGGTVLDPFAGTGTTGEAAWREGMSAILIEREEEYQADIRERMRLCLAGPDERKREILKRRGEASDDAGPLFGGSDLTHRGGQKNLRPLRRSGRKIGPIGLKK